MEILGRKKFVLIAIKILEEPSTTSIAKNLKQALDFYDTEIDHAQKEETKDSNNLQEGNAKLNSFRNSIGKSSSFRKINPLREIPIKSRQLPPEVQVRS